jgi:hypothetical protein
VPEDARLGSIAALATSDTFTFRGASETSLNNWFIQLESPTLFARPARRVAVDVSKPCDIACSGAPSRDAMSPMLREPRVVRSELKTELELAMVKSTSFL